MLGAWWGYPLGSLAGSHSSFAALLLLFKYLCLLLTSLFDFLMRSLIFQWDLAFGLQYFHLHVCHVRGVFVCLILGYVFLFKVLEPILSFSCVVAAATLLTPLVIIIGRVFNSGDLFALMLFYLAVFLNYNYDLRKFSPVFSVGEVGVDVSAVSTASCLPMCVCSLPGLLPGCYALALVDTWHTTVDCLLPASSAAALWALWSWLKVLWLYTLRLLGNRDR